MAAVVAAQFLAGAASGLAGKVLSLDWATLAPQIHTLVRHPHCPACGTRENPVMRPMQLQPGKAALARRAPQCCAGKNAEKVRASGQPDYRRGADAGAGAPG
jgi:bacteriocin biosynthesis cyclodehydratase domain-containing protein